MSAFTIPRHKRFAVRQSVRLRAGPGEILSGLLIEVSLEGCRINAGSGGGLGVDQVVTVEVAGFGDIRGLVRSASGHSIAVRFAQPISSAELQELIWSPCEEPEPILQLPAFRIRSAAA